MRTPGNGNQQNDKIRKQAGDRTLWCGDLALFFVIFCPAAHGLRIVSCKLISRKMRPIGGYIRQRRRRLYNAGHGACCFQRCLSLGLAAGGIGVTQHKIHFIRCFFQPGSHLTEKAVVQPFSARGTDVLLQPFPLQDSRGAVLRG